MNNEHIVLRDDLSYTTPLLIRECVHLIRQLNIWQEEATVENKNDDAHGLEDMADLVNLVAARALTQRRAIKFLTVGLIVTNSMWFANLMGWV